MSGTLWCFAFIKFLFQFFLYTWVGSTFLLGGISFTLLENSYCTITKSSASLELFLLRPVACIFGFIRGYDVLMQVVVTIAFIMPLPDIPFHGCIF